MKQSSKRRFLGLLLFGIGFVVASCSAPPQEKKAEAPPVAPEPAGVPLKVSINAVMVGMVDHAAHSIWDAAVPEKAPKNDKAWDEVAHHAIQLAAAGSIISMAGTGKADAEWVKKPEWQRYASELAVAGAEAWDASQRKDLKAISAVGDKIVEVCEGCHKVYKGDLPTEGIAHPH